MASPEPSAESASGSPLSRRDRKKERTRRQIYDAAMRLFAERGFEAVPISDICEAADVGRGTFFLHYPTKAALLYELNRRVAEDFRRSLCEPRASAREELARLVERMSAELGARAEILSAMIADFYASPETLAAAPEHAAAIFELVTDIIRRGQERGEFARRVDPRLAAVSFFATSGALVNGYVTEGWDASPEELHRQFLQLTFAGLSPEGDRSADGRPGR